MIQVIHRAVMIMEYIKRSDKTVRLPEIAEATGLSTATCANILNSLVEKRLLDQTGQRRNYSYKIGRLIYQLSGINSLKEDLLSASKIPMRDFTMTTGASCILTLLEDEYRILIHEVKTQNRLQVSNEEKITAYSSATGRTILAHLRDIQINQFIKHHGLPSESQWPGVTTVEALKRELEVIRADGMVARISVDQIFGVAAPVHDEKNVIAGIGAYLPVAYYTEDKAVFIKQSLQDCVETIEEKLRELL